MLGKDSWRVDDEPREQRADGRLGDALGEVALLLRTQVEPRGTQEVVRGRGETSIEGGDGAGTRPRRCHRIHLLLLGHRGRWCV